MRVAYALTASAGNHEGTWTDEQQLSASFPWYKDELTSVATREN